MSIKEIELPAEYRKKAIDYYKNNKLEYEKEYNIIYKALENSGEFKDSSVKEIAHNLTISHKAWELYDPNNEINFDNDVS